MDRWTPATTEEIAAIIERDLSECSEDLVALFESIRTPMRAVPITRYGKSEFVYIVAERNGVVVYYEDVEEGFNLAELATDGAIATPGYEQWQLQHALRQLEAQHDT